MRREGEDVPELLQQIQSRLSLEEAVRTSVLSKSWLQAWSTNPTLRFAIRRDIKSMKLVDVDRTLTRYLRDNIPIERFDLVIDIDNQELASHAEKWIRPVVTKTCLKEIFLSICNAYYRSSFALPDEIFSGENLTKMKVLALAVEKHPVWMTTSQHSVINCVALRELHLEGVCIREEVLGNILSSCSLLEKIALIGSCKEFKTIKIKNLPRLHELQIALDSIYDTALDVSDVPNLVVFECDQNFVYRPDTPLPFNAHSVSVGSSVTCLMLAGVIPDNVCLGMIKTGFPLLQILTLHLTSWMSGSFHFTCTSIKKLSLLSCPNSLVDVQVHAPKLIIFDFTGGTLPSLLFPVSSLKKTTISLIHPSPVDADFFLKMRETLTLSHKCYLYISTNMQLDSNINIDDLRTRLLFPPARNVQELSFVTYGDECKWERSPFFDAFFEICHPKHVFAMPDTIITHNNHFCRLMLREVLEKKTTTTAYWPHYLTHVQIRRDPHQNWKTLRNFHRSFLDGSAPGVYLDFKLKWQC